MITEDKVTELFCMADDFCKFFDAMMEKYTLKSGTKRRYHRDSTMSKAEIMLIMILFHDSGYRCLKPKKTKNYFVSRLRLLFITTFAIVYNCQFTSHAEKGRKKSIIEICPVRNVIARFGNKWALLVVLVISENECVRFNELCRLIPDVSSRVLSGTLKTLEADALVARKVYPTVPSKVEYRLTEIGRSLVPLIAQLTEWAQTNMKTIVKHRKAFEAEAAE